MINGNIHADKDKYKNGKMINTDMRTTTAPLRKNY